jgi:2-polyprenyl-3-methyl-5-hydroxy-6-metoxy-1,4-benzoquinol methylase
VKPPVFNPDWPEDVQAVYRHDMQEMWDPSIARHIWNQYHNQLDLYLSLADKRQGLKVLDIGCAQATLALLLAERGHEVWAVDIRQQFLDYAATRYEKGKVNFLCGNVTELDLEQRFDLIFANQIVEHLVYPLQFTERLLRWLTPDGLLVMTTPNGDYIKNSLPSFSELGDPRQYDNRQFTADGDGHFFAYREKELKEILVEAGFKRVRVYYFETPFISGHVKMRYFHPFIPTSVLKILDRSTLGLPGIGKRLAHQLMVIGSLSA